MSYALAKGLERGQNPKTRRERFLTVDEVRHLLNTIRKSEHKDRTRDRDHCAILLGYHLGLRVVEATWLERAFFKGLRHGDILVPTAKSLPRIQLSCDCGRRVRVSCTKMGCTHECPKCGKSNLVPVREVSTNPPLQIPPVVETRVIEYAQDYMDNVMRPDQRWLFEGQHAPDDAPADIPHMTTRSLNRIFSYWCREAGLSPLYSWHSLRHARGVYLYERFGDLDMVKKMLRQKHIATAEIYIDMSPARQDKLRNALDESYVGA